ncbi:hypothetical protein GCM10017600_37910 [Streptosporangium carneum]|uniref:Uncharacterized protein n=1 Tax=Streptosporangium carneum TaxID=47481 RepID=A0A9W6I3P0_9ACTN|nr:hypothetical protein GCM10017600_37910 [Streptosporangium carneum]
MTVREKRCTAALGADQVGVADPDDVDALFPQALDGPLDGLRAHWASLVRPDNSFGCKPYVRNTPGTSLHRSETIDLRCETSQLRAYRKDPNK